MFAIDLVRSALACFSLAIAVKTIPGVIDAPPGDDRVTDLSRKALNIEDLRRMARRRLTKALFEFADRGSEDEVAMRDNRASLDRIKLMPRILNDVSGRDPKITLFGKPQALPLLIGPTGPAGFVAAAPNGTSSMFGRMLRPRW
jgi:hypothetical protein